MSEKCSSREAYGNIKREIEGALLRLHDTCGLPVTILQPTIVYGPNGGRCLASYFERRADSSLRSFASP
jgi:nucleoside-diphosphate-sugar epimerase